MLMIHNPSSTSQINTVDISQPTSYETTHQAEIPPGARLIFPDADPTPTAGQQNKLKKIGHFIADYSGRRAQTNYVCCSLLGRVSVVVGYILWLIACHRHSNF